MKKHKVAVVGLGMVGNALDKYFTKQNYEIYRYDKDKKLGSYEEINKAEYIYICVPTPFREECGCDTSIVEEVIGRILEPKTIIIKSTIIPGTTKMLQEEYPQHKILFNPEFLTEATADQDMNYPDRQIVGYTEQSYCVAKDIIQQLPLAPFERIIPATEAEFIKYAGNTWFSTKVIFVNQLFDLCEKLKIDYDTIADGLGADKRIGRTHLKVWHKGYRGYSGKCLPKDTKAFIKLGNDLGVDLKLLKTVDKINEELCRN